MLPMKLEETGFGLYELNQYAYSSRERQMLVEERDRVIQELYDDISPTVTRMDYATGKLVRVSYHPEETALYIIDERQKYDSIIAKWEAKANMFDKAMEQLEPRERDVIAVVYFNRMNDLGVSDEYFSNTLQSAQIKLCSVLKNMKAETLEEYKVKRKREIKAYISTQAI